MLAISKLFILLTLNSTEAPDASALGPQKIGQADYRFKAATDPSILSDRVTEIWGRLFWPIDKEPRSHPVIIFLHGNHGPCGVSHGTNWREDTTCEYTLTGVCPTGKVIVPNHRGFDYLATRLASWGYIVASINANRGINCGSGIPTDEGLNLARGRLVLKHLQILSEWNRGIRPAPRKLGIDLRNKFDFSQVGLLGHSRGGEGVRAAYLQYRDETSPWPSLIPDSLNFKAIFEIAGMDGQQSRLMNPEGVAWAQILPACDGDNALLLGARPFDRVMAAHNEQAPTLKSLLYVYGANHNYFSTEWHESDSLGCVNHSPLFTIDHPSTSGSQQQRDITLKTAMALFRGNLGRNPKTEFNRIFDPQFSLPNSLENMTRVERAHLSTPNVSVNPLLEDFEAKIPYNPFQYLNLLSNITFSLGHVLDYYSEISAGKIRWTRSGSDVFFQSTWAAPESGIDLSKPGYLSFRISRAPNTFSQSEFADFGLSLVDSDGNESLSIRFSDFAYLPEPVGYFGWIHPVLNTVLIPLDAFSGVNKFNLRALKLTFDSTSAGTINLDEIRFVPRNPEALSSIASIQKNNFQFSFRGPEEVIPKIHSKMARLIFPTELKNRSSTDNVELRFEADEAFPVGGSLLSLEVDGKDYRLSDFYDSSDLRKLEFKIPVAEIDQVLHAKSMKIYSGALNVWGVLK